MAKNSPGQLVMYATIVLSIISVLFATLLSRFDAILFGIGVGLVIFGLEFSNGYVLLLSSMAIFLAAFLPFGHSSELLIQGFREGFSNEASEEEEGFDSDDDNEGFEEEKPKPVKKKTEGFAGKKKRVPPPDNGDRAEMFELGKEYKMPKESDDPDYHLDAGTTFLNAYKSLKPDQISAMTKDTQDLINTQKQLMATLNTLKPLITDGKQMMDTFQGYFGNGGAGIGDLSQLAEKFAPK